ncbi:MAG: GNAT family N-acetyltransferase [Clostridia bacterium]|nr:GNAT family N-acetyltransferase [Clostridia bacterium]
MELRWLKAEDYNELLDMLNHTFGTHYGREMDFISTQPKMWVRDDEHMGKHLGIFDGDRLASVVGIYELPTMIGEKLFKFYTTGNVATRPEYTGRGYFTKIFDEIMKELEVRGADGARLGGARQRYARYGFEPVGTPHVHTITEKNRIQGFGDVGGDIDFIEILPDDAKSLAYCDKLSKEADIHVLRSAEHGYRDVYLALCSKHAAPYLAVRDGKPIGYISAYRKSQNVGKSENGEKIAEWRTERAEDAPNMMCAWQRRVGSSIYFEINPLYTELQRLFTPHSESVLSESHHRFKILNYVGIADALLKLRAKREVLPEIDFVLKISDYGSIHIHTDKDAASCTLTDKPSDLTLERSCATRFLFGQLDTLSAAVAPTILRSILPLPLAWCTQDYV